MSNYFYDLIISSCGERNSCCFSGSCCHFVVEMIRWKSSHSAVCVLANYLTEVPACCYRICCTFSGMCMSVIVNMHECMPASYHMEFPFEPARRVTFDWLKLTFHPFLYVYNNNNSVLNCWSMIAPFSSDKTAVLAESVSWVFFISTEQQRGLEIVKSGMCFPF